MIGPRCRAYFYRRGVIRYRHGKRCELVQGHSGPHRNWVDARFLDPRESFTWGGRPRRCASTYPGIVTLLGRSVRCEGRAGHDGQHGHSFAARYWE